MRRTPRDRPKYMAWSLVPTVLSVIVAVLHFTKGTGVVWSVLFAVLQPWACLSTAVAWFFPPFYLAILLLVLLQYLLYAFALTRAHEKGHAGAAWCGVAIVHGLVAALSVVLYVR